MWVWYVAEWVLKYLYPLLYPGFFIQRGLILKEERDYNKIKRAKETPLISSFTICIILDGGFSKNSILLLMSSLSMLGSI
jgi:hypothetical protein